MSICLSDFFYDTYIDYRNDYFKYNLINHIKNKWGPYSIQTIILIQYYLIIDNINFLSFDKYVLNKFIKYSRNQRYSLSNLK